VAAHLARSRAVTVLTWTPGARVTRSVTDGVTTVSVPALARWDRDRHPAVAAANASVSIATATAAAIALRRRWDVVVGAGLHPEGTVAALAGRALRRPYMAESWLTGPLGNAARLHHSSLRKPVVRLLSSAAAVLSATDEAGDELRAVGLRVSTLRTVPWGVRPEFFLQPTPDDRARVRDALGIATPRMLVYAGRFDLRQKRLDLLLGAWAGAAPEGWALVLVGEGPDRDRIQAQAAASPTPAAIHRWRDDPWVALAAADAFALPTEFESPGIALFEGMAAGLAGIASGIATYRRIAPPGVVLVRNQVADWSEALRALPARDRATDGAAARDWATRHASEAAGVDALIALLDG
jgi:glycosyltransferase involved in cell wall biosynthesis